MDALLLGVGIILGAALAYVLLRRRDRVAWDVLRQEMAQALEARAAVERSRIVQVYERRLRALESRQAEAISYARQQSTAQSRAVLKGKMAEQMAPLLPGFGYWPADARFLGDPIDYVIFNGYSTCQDGTGEDEDLEVVVLDIKQGKSSLTAGQRQIARAVEAGRVRFEVVRVYEDGTVRTQDWRSHRATDGGMPEE